jgi:hypothetical protein
MLNKPLLLATLVFGTLNAIGTDRGWPLPPAPPALQVAPGSPAEPPAYPDGLFCSEAGTVNADGLVVNPGAKCMCTHTNYSADCDNPSQDAQTPDCLQYCGKPKCHCHIMCSLPVVDQGEAPEDQP